MTNEPVELPVRGRRKHGGPNIHTFVFRSYDLIVESDEADLVRDVCLDIDKAQPNTSPSDYNYSAFANTQR